VQELREIEARFTAAWSLEDPPEMADSTVYDRCSGRVRYLGVWVRGIVTGH
jgi:hypothetical protein